MSPKKITILISSITVILVIGYYVFFMRTEQISQERVIGEVVRTEEIECGGKTYVFDTVKVSTRPETHDRVYFNDVYKNKRAEQNFIIRLKSQRWGAFGAFKFLSIDKKDCSAVYLTSVFMETDAPYADIFKWQLDDEGVTKLVIGDMFFGHYTPTQDNKWISPSGERILIAIPNAGLGSQDYCRYKTLKLLNFSEDKSVELIRLPDNEDFVDGFTDLSPYCGGLSFGWVNNSTIYYDVYDATVEVNYVNNTFRPLIERRTLIVK